MSLESGGGSHEWCSGDAVNVWYNAWTRLSWKLLGTLLSIDNFLTGEPLVYI